MMMTRRRNTVTNNVNSIRLSMVEILMNQGSYWTLLYQLSTRSRIEDDPVDLVSLMFTSITVSASVS